MAVNDPILASQYNTTRGKVAQVLGTAQADRGYGVAVSSSDLVLDANSQYPVIDDSHWDNLRADIEKSYKHQFGETPTITDIYQGLTIQWAHALQYDTLADTILANKDTVYTGATGGSFTAQVNNLQSASQTLSSGWGRGVDAKTFARLNTFTVSWGNEAIARQFFNTGGQFRLALTTSTAGPYFENTKPDQWLDMITALNISSAVLIDATKYRTAAAGGTSSWNVTATGGNPYSENYASLTINYVNAYTFNVACTFADIDSGDLQGIGRPDLGFPDVVVDETIPFDTYAAIAYRVSVDQIAASPPITTVPAWVTSGT